MKARIAALVLILAMLASCAKAVPVGEILKNPEAFRGKVVAVKGTVRGALKLPFMKEGYYRVDDGTGTIVVIARGEMPAEGETITVRGHLEPTVAIAGQTFGLVLVPEKP